MKPAYIRYYIKVVFVSIKDKLSDYISLVFLINTQKRQSSRNI